MTSVGCSELVAAQPTVLLHASQREHMNLIRYEGRRMMELGDLPLELQQLWGVHVPGRAVDKARARANAAAEAPAAAAGLPPARCRPQTNRNKGTRGNARMAAHGLAARGANRTTTCQTVSLQKPRSHKKGAGKAAQAARDAAAAGAFAACARGVASTHTPARAGKRKRAKSTPL